MKKTVILLSFLIITLLIIFLGSYVFSDRTPKETPIISTRPKCPYFVDYIKTETERIYTNTVLGFSIQVPKGWYIAPENDTDPRFYNCDNVEGGSSLGIYTTYATTYLDSAKLLKTEEKIYTDLVPGAVVIADKMEDLDHAPWGFLYTIVFEKEKKIFELIVPGNIEESALLPTLKIIQ